MSDYSFVNVGVLNHGRYNLLEKTLDSVRDLKRYGVEFTLMDNASPSDEVKKIKSRYLRLFNNTIFSPTNLGIGGGINQLHRVARMRRARYFMMLENDWECRSINLDWFFAAIEILEKHKSACLVKLRNRNDGQYDMRGDNYPNVTNLYNPWFVEPLLQPVTFGVTSSMITYGVSLAKRGYSNNPHLMRMSSFEGHAMNESVKGKGLEEEEYEHLPFKLGYETASLMNGPFAHIG